MKPSYFLFFLLAISSFFPSRLLAQRGHQSSLDPALQRFLEQKISQYSAREKAALYDALWQMVLIQESPHKLPYASEKCPQEPNPGKACNDCGQIRAIPGDPCQGLKDAYAEAAEDWATYDLIARLLTDLQDYNGKIEFVSGVADMISNGIAAYTFVTTLGAGTVASKLATKKIKQIAIGKLKSSVAERMAGLLPPPYDQAVQGDISGAALTQMIANAQKARAEAQKRKSELIAKINACTTQYTASLATIHSNNQAVQNCQRANPDYCVK